MVMTRRKAVLLGSVMVLAALLQIVAAAVEDGPVRGRDLVGVVPAVLVIGSLILTLRSQEDPGPRLKRAGWVFVSLAVVLGSAEAVVLVRDDAPSSEVNEVVCAAARQVYSGGNRDAVLLDTLDDCKDSGFEVSR